MSRGSLITIKEKPPAVTSKAPMRVKPAIKKGVAKKKSKGSYFSNKQLAIALEMSGGHVAQSAKILKTSYGAVRSRIENHPDLQLIQTYEREQLFELAEGVLKNHILENNLDAAKFVVERLGKKLGYQKNDSQTNIQVNISHEDALAQLEEKDVS